MLTLLCSVANRNRNVCFLCLLFYKTQTNFSSIYWTILWAMPLPEWTLLLRSLMKCRSNLKGLSFFFYVKLFVINHFYSAFIFLIGKTITYKIKKIWYCDVAKRETFILGVIRTTNELKWKFIYTQIRLTTKHTYLIYSIQLQLTVIVFKFEL